MEREARPSHPDVRVVKGLGRGSRIDGLFLVSVSIPKDVNAWGVV